MQLSCPISTKVQLLAFILAVTPFFGPAQQQQAPVNYLHITGPIKFNEQQYHLRWSSHPSNNYYKQEYLVPGTTQQQYKTMIMVEALTGDFLPGDLMAAKVAELKQMGLSNPHISYESFYNKEKDEYQLDFIITQSSPDQQSLQIAERNIYRYSKFTDKKNHSGIMLFAFSERRYGKDCLAFIKTSISNRSVLSAKVRNIVLPTISL